MKEKFENTKMENESKAKEKLKKKKEKRTATHRELLKLNIKCQRQAKQRCAAQAEAEAEAKARTKAQKSCHMQRSSAKMAATWLTSCKRAKGIREGNQRGTGDGGVSKFLAKMKSMQAPRYTEDNCPGK